jgi:hypothetical protein
MAHRKKVLFKYIILGDSGWVVGRVKEGDTRYFFEPEGYGTVSEGVRSRINMLDP